MLLPMHMQIIDRNENPQVKLRMDGESMLSLQMKIMQYRICVLLGTYWIT